jgi:hypothetical protein
MIILEFEKERSSRNNFILKISFQKFMFKMLKKMILIEILKFLSS